MDRALKQRMVGAVVLIALAVIFIPMLLDGSSQDERRDVSLDIPAKPDQEYRSRVLPLDESEGGAEQEDASARQGSVRREGVSEDAPAGAPQPPAAGSDDTPETSTAAAGDEPASDASGTGEAMPAQPTPQPGTGGGRETGASAPASGEQGGALVNWFVQVGSFAKEANAVELRDRLREAGYSAFTETFSAEGNVTHRVRVGPEMDKGRAEQIRDDIARQYELEGIVVSEP